MKQPTYCPMAMEEIVVSLFAGVHGFLDNIAVQDIDDFEAEALKAIKARHPQYLKEIREKKEISESLCDSLTDFYKNFEAEFLKAKQEAA